MEYKVPLKGFGTFNGFENAEKMAEAVKYAIQIGYRHFDLAKLYENEKEVGAAIRECIDKGLVKRSELFIVSKLWCADFAPGRVEQAYSEALERTGLDYLDNFMLHWPVEMKPTYRRIQAEFGGDFQYEIVHQNNIVRLCETWKSLEFLVKHTELRSIGVSNFDIPLLQGLLKNCTIPPLANEVEIHPYLQQPKLYDFCKEQGIQLIAYSPLGKIGYKDKDDPNLLADAVVVEIANEIGKSPAQVLLRWSVQRGIAVIPKSTNPLRIKENFYIDFELTDSQMTRLCHLDRGHRFVKVSWYDFKEPIFTKQPRIIAGEIKGTRYKNSFHRSSKKLHSDIILERGALNNLKNIAQDILPKCCHTEHNYIITDTIVESYLGEKVLNGIKEAGIWCHKIIVPSVELGESGDTSTERYKTLKEFEFCCDEILKYGISKNSCIISLGGGVINNLCGFIASCLYRGISLVHITTTMMGMTDAAIDFKQAVNHPRGKNLLGAYYPASTILIDTEALSSLSHRHILNGISEALKHALAQSKECVKMIVDPLYKNSKKALNDTAYLEKVCMTCINYKVPTLIHYHESDFNEMVPQYGHQFGHAIEHLSFKKTTDADPLLHGEAVAIGMCLSIEVSFLMGFASSEVVDEHYQIVSQAQLPVYIPEGIEIDDIVDKMTVDKHFVKKTTMGLLCDIGKMASVDGSYSFKINRDIIREAAKRNILKREELKTTEGPR